MPWSNSSGRTAPLPRDWPRRRAAVLRRDGYSCRAVFTTGEICGEPATDVDHIRSASELAALGLPDDHSLSNLRALCPWCHSRKTSAEAAARRAPRPTRRRAPEAHPGLLPATPSPSPSAPRDAAPAPF